MNRGRILEGSSLAQHEKTSYDSSSRSFPFSPSLLDHHKCLEFWNWQCPSLFLLSILYTPNLRLSEITWCMQTDSWVKRIQLSCNPGDLFIYSDKVWCAFCGCRKSRSGPADQTTTTTGERAPNSHLHNRGHSSAISCSAHGSVGIMASAQFTLLAGLIPLRVG